MTQELKIFITLTCLALTTLTATNCQRRTTSSSLDSTVVEVVENNKKLPLSNTSIQTEPVIPKKKYYQPDNDLGILFHDVQMSGIFADSKTFVDCRPMSPTQEILQNYLNTKDQPDFDLASFLRKYFDCTQSTTYQIPPKGTEGLESRVTYMWGPLTRKPDKVRGQGSLIPLPYKYVVPGGRFREVYYWDSYFTMEGLVSSGKTELAQNMVDNFAYLIKNYGVIPNANRSYFLSRSQPPFFSLMVMLLGQSKGLNATLPYLDALKLEYKFWMDGASSLSAENRAYKRVVRMEDGSILNRYWDNQPTPRAESYAEDFILAQALDEQERTLLYRNIRAACESGWDFSSRWFKDGKNLSSIATTEILPVDLNCLLYHLESAIAIVEGASGNQDNAKTFNNKAASRKKAINKYFWHQGTSFYNDFNFLEKKHTERLSLAGSYPLYFNIAPRKNAKLVMATIEDKFLHKGGLVSTLVNSGQQWDYPNGWAPLHWMTVNGVKNYGNGQLANTIKERWLAINQKVLSNTGKIMEKYNVVDMDLEAGGGEYDNQDGFGWTNGVAIAFIKNTKATGTDL